MSVQPKSDERVFLVVVDESPEMRNALRYACRRAKRTGGRVAMLYVMDPPEGQQWGSVVELMREEARQQAEEVVARHADVAVSLTGQPPSIYIREGKSRDELMNLLIEDRSPRRRSTPFHEACDKLERFSAAMCFNSLFVSELTTKVTFRKILLNALINKDNS